MTVTTEISSSTVLQIMHGIIQIPIIPVFPDFYRLWVAGSYHSGCLLLVLPSKLPDGPKS
jgi:hypothetical protein